MEKEVNFYVEELLEKLGKQKNWILTAQMNKLAICFDIFLECTDRDNFPREKLFYHHVRYDIILIAVFNIRNWNFFAFDFSEITLRTFVFAALKFGVNGYKKMKRFCIRTLKREFLSITYSYVPPSPSTIMSEMRKKLCTG